MRRGFVLLLTLSLSACGFRLAGDDSAVQFPAGTTVFLNEAQRFNASLHQSFTRAGATIVETGELATLRITTDVKRRNRALQIDNNADATEVEQQRTTVVRYIDSISKQTGERRFVSTRQRLVTPNSSSSARLADRLHEDMEREQQQQITAWLVREIQRHRSP